jgi:hypothetical protein
MPELSCPVSPPDKLPYVTLHQTVMLECSIPVKQPLRPPYMAPVIVVRNQSIRLGVHCKACIDLTTQIGRHPMIHNETGVKDQLYHQPIGQLPSLVGNLTLPT